jgi:hypothetical protein
MPDRHAPSDTSDAHARYLSLRAVYLAAARAHRRAEADLRRAEGAAREALVAWQAEEGRSGAPTGVPDLWPDDLLGEGASRG